MAEISAWHDYFVMVGGGSAALTGLIFVAMTLHLEEITGNPVHRHRARTILTGFSAVFIRCGLVFMGGQGFRPVALELIAVLTVVEVILYTSIRQAMRSADRGVLLRTIGSFACLLLEEAGAMVAPGRSPTASDCRRQVGLSASTLPLARGRARYDQVPAG